MDGRVNAFHAEPKNRMESEYAALRAVRCVAWVTVAAMSVALGCAGPFATSAIKDESPAAKSDSTAPASATASTKPTKKKSAKNNSSKNNSPIKTITTTDNEIPSAKDIGLKPVAD